MISMLNRFSRTQNRDSLTFQRLIVHAEMIPFIHRFSLVDPFAGENEMKRACKWFGKVSSLLQPENFKRYPVSMISLERASTNRRKQQQQQKIREIEKQEQNLIRNTHTGTLCTTFRRLSRGKRKRQRERDYIMWKWLIGLLSSCEQNSWNEKRNEK